MSTQEITSNRDQDTLWQILGISSLTAIPMRISSWIVYHAVARGFETYPLQSGVAWIGLLTIGLAWLLVLSLLIARREEGGLRRGVRQMGWGPKRHDLPLPPPAPPLGSMASSRAGLLYALTARRFCSNWLSIILHSGQTVFMLFLISGLVLGLAQPS
jgi:hypothetical protein